MRRSRGSLSQVVRNLFGPDLPVWRRMALAARNGLRRIGPPPRDCCGHPGEPGC